MEDLDIILEGAMVGAEMDALTEAKIESAEAKGAFKQFKDSLDMEIKTYKDTLDDISRKANDAKVTAAIKKIESNLNKAARADAASIMKNIKQIESKFKYKATYSGNVKSTESDSDRNARVEKLYAELGKIKLSDVATQTSKVVSEFSKSLEELQKVANNPKDLNKIKVSIPGKKGLIPFDSLVKKSKSEVKKAEASDGIIRKTLDTITNKIQSVYNSFKDELSGPSYKGTAIAATAAIAAYGVLYGALKGMKIPGLGSIISPVATIKLAVKVAGSPSTYGAGKSMLTSAILTIILGALGVTGTMVFNLIKAKFKK